SWSRSGCAPLRRCMPRPRFLLRSREQTSIPNDIRLRGGGNPLHPLLFTPLPAFAAWVGIRDGLIPVADTRQCSGRVLLASRESPGSANGSTCRGAPKGSRWSSSLLCCCCGRIRPRRDRAPPYATIHRRLVGQSCLKADDDKGSGMSKRSASSSRSPAAGTGAAVPEAPADLPATSCWAPLTCTVVEFKEDNLPDLAAGLTYYAVLSIFPALLVLVSLLGLAGQSPTDTISDQLSAVAPDETVEIVTGVLTNLQANQATASLVGLLSLALAVWSASA